MARYHVIVEEEIGGTRVVVVSEPTDSYLVCWQNHDGDVETSSRMSPGFIARVLSQFGGAKDLIGRLGASLFQRPPRS